MQNYGFLQASENGFTVAFFHTQALKIFSPAIVAMAGLIGFNPLQFGAGLEVFAEDGGMGFESFNPLQFGAGLEVLAFGALLCCCQVSILFSLERVWKTIRWPFLVSNQVSILFSLERVWKSFCAFVLVLRKVSILFSLERVWKSLSRKLHTAKRFQSSSVWSGSGSS